MENVTGKLHRPGLLERFQPPSLQDAAGRTREGLHSSGRRLKAEEGHGKKISEEREEERSGEGILVGWMWGK